MLKCSVLSGNTFDSHQHPTQSLLNENSSAVYPLHVIFLWCLNLTGSHCGRQDQLQKDTSKELWIDFDHKNPWALSKTNPLRLLMQCNQMHWSGLWRGCTQQHELVLLVSLLRFQVDWGHMHSKKKKKHTFLIYQMKQCSIQYTWRFYCYSLTLYGGMTSCVGG